VKVQGQEVERSRSHHDITCTKIRKIIINNSAGDCSISLKFHTDFHHVMSDVTRTVKVDRSKVKSLCDTMYQ